MDTVGVVFIHGAGLGSYIWEEVRLSLPVLLVNFPERGADPRKMKDLELRDYLNSVKIQIDNFEVEKVILVGHSLGGIVILALNEILKERIVGIVGISAVFPKSGQSFLSTLPFSQRFIMSLIVRLVGTKPPESAIKQSLCSDLNEDQTQTVLQNYTAESSKIYFAKINYSRLKIPALYRVSKGDKEFSFEFQEKMARNINASQLIHVEGGHLAMLSNARVVSLAIEKWTQEILKKNNKRDNYNS